MRKGRAVDELRDAPPFRRFLKLSEVAELLSISNAQVYALVRRKDLRAIKIGGRGQYRVETSEVESFIERMYAKTGKYLDSHPFTSDQARESSFDEDVQGEE